MKYALAILPLYLGCTIPKPVEKPRPIVIEIEPSIKEVGKETIFEEEISYKRVVGFTTESFTHMLRQQRRQTLAGRLYFNNSDHLLEYHYEPLPFCDPDRHERYEGKITFEYYSSEQIGNKKLSTLITLTDVAPFGTVDRVELFVDGTARIPFYANYPAGGKAQKLHEALFRIMYSEMELHAQRNTTWDNFEPEKIIGDKNWATYKVHQELLHNLFSQEPLRWEELKIYNPCGL